MSSHNHPDRSRARSWIALGVAAGVLLLSHVGYQAASARYARIQRGTPVPPGTLAKLPITIGAWEGKDEPLDERIVRATDTDDHVSRRYSRGADTVHLFVAYGVSLRDLMPHRPEVCYVGAGWTRDERPTETVLGGGVLPVQIQHFHRGGLEARKMTVLNYYIVNGEYCGDVSLLRKRAAELNESSAAYSAQVQVTCSQGLEEEAERLVSEFAVASAPFIRELLEVEVRRAAGLATTPASEPGTELTP
jgi:EpsI family protein